MKELTDEQIEILRNCVIGRINAIDEIIDEGGNGVDLEWWRLSKEQHFEALHEFERMCANMHEMRVVNNRQ